MTRIDESAHDRATGEPTDCWESEIRARIDAVDVGWAASISFEQLRPEMNERGVGS